jgi:hypothetical protein
LIICTAEHCAVIRKRTSVSSGCPHLHWSVLHLERCTEM